MSSDEFHAKPFDEGTLVKLDIFELYTREWLPVFLARDNPPREEIHLFDFFAGPGFDPVGVPGSPIRLLRQLSAYRGLPGWNRVRVHVHLFDQSKRKVDRLRDSIRSSGLWFSEVGFDLRVLDFADAFELYRQEMTNPCSAKLVFIDQMGWDKVTESVFLTMVDAPTCDFLFFITSSTLSRFASLPIIKQKFQKPPDHFHIHRVVVEWYRGLIAKPAGYYLAPFSIKKRGSNIYGLIFGSKHPLGMSKFLDIAWKKDSITGEANFQIDRDDLNPDQLSLGFDVMKPTKIQDFEARLEKALTGGAIRDEADLIRFCLERGVRRQHSRPVLDRLKASKSIECDFQVPDIRRIKEPRPISLCKVASNRS